MIKRILIVLSFFIVILNVFAVEHEHANTLVDHCVGDQHTVSDASEHQPLIQSIPFSNNPPRLRSTILCPMCDREMEPIVVDGDLICPLCEYSFGHALGVDTIPVEDSIWVLFAIACIYAYLRKIPKKRKANSPIQDKMIT